MKILKTFLLAVMVIAAMSCKKGDKDENLSSELVGTTWASRSSVNPTTNYRILKFKDTKNVDWVNKNSSSDPETTEACTYTLKEKTLKVTFPGTAAIIWTGEIINNEVRLKPDIGSNTLTFKKEQ